MTNFEHFYSRYGLALVMLEKNTDSFESLEPKDFYNLNKKVQRSYIDKSNIKYNVDS